MASSIFTITGEGFKKAFPNMVYGNALFIISIIIRSLIFNASRARSDLEDYLYLLAGLSMIFFLGLLVSIAPTLVGGALLALWLNKDKESMKTQTGLGTGAIIGFIGMAIVCAFIYPIDKPHGLPDPSFPINAGTAIVISTIAGARTGMQLAKNILKSRQ
jgi:hypothetical protein